MTIACSTSRRGVAAGLDQRVPLGHQAAPQDLGRLAERPVGGHRAPGQPAAPLEEVGERARDGRRRPASTGSDRTWGPAWSTACQSARPQQCRPAMAPPSTTASADDTRSSVSSTPSGNPGSSAAVRPGSSRNSSGVAPGAARRAACQHLADPGLDRLGGHGEGPVGGHADGVQGQAQGHRAR